MDSACSTTAVRISLCLLGDSEHSVLRCHFQVLRPETCRTYAEHELTFLNVFHQKADQTGKSRFNFLCQLHGTKSNKFNFFNTCTNTRFSTKSLIYSNPSKAYQGVANCLRSTGSERSQRNKT